MRGTLGFNLGFLAYSAGVVVLYELVGWSGLSVPWPPVVVAAVVVALPFAAWCRAAHARHEAARDAWARIVGASRAFGHLATVLVRPRPGDEAADRDPVAAARKALVYRHVAWLTALRHELRARKPWELHGRSADAARRRYGVVEYEEVLGDVIEPLLPAGEADRALAAHNPVTQILRMQGRALGEVRANGLIDDAGHLAMQQAIGALFEPQACTEQLKNQPLALGGAPLVSLGLAVGLGLIPLALVAPLDAMGWGLVWVTVPISGGVAAWLHAQERLAAHLAFPFQGLPTDVPITALARDVEVELLDMLGEVPPPPVAPVDDVLT